VPTLFGPPPILAGEEAEHDELIGRVYVAINRDQPQNLLEHLPGNGDVGHLEGNAAAWLMTLAPILISFSFRLDSDRH
jgi:hypothetical protein